MSRRSTYLRFLIAVALAIPPLTALILGNTQLGNLPMEWAGPR